MKKFGIGCLGVIGVFILLIVVASLAFGGGEETATTDTSTTDSAATPAKEEAKKEEAPKETAGIGQEIQVGDVFFTVNEVSTATSLGGEYGVKAQSQFTVVNVTIRNEQDEAMTVDSSFFKLKSGERTYDSDGGAGVYANEDADFFLTSVNPGVSLTGNVVFDVPADLENPQMEVQTGFFGGDTGIINISK